MSFQLHPLHPQPSFDRASIDTGFHSQNLSTAQPTPFGSQTTLFKKSSLAYDRLDNRSVSAAHVDSTATLSQHDRIRVHRAITWRVVILLGAMYSISLVDRTTTSLAMNAGMGRDLNLIDERYNMLNAILFVALPLLVLPSAVLVRRWGPRRLLMTATLLWGLTTISSGFIKTWGELMALRFLLGIWEAGLLPGCIYLIQCWFPRHHLAKAITTFFIVGTVPAGLSGSLVAGIIHLEGQGAGPEWWGAHLQNGTVEFPNGDFYNTYPVSDYDSGIAGWRWIFFFMGTIACLISIAAWYLLVDFPDKISHTSPQRVKFLTEPELSWAVKQISQDRQDAVPPPFDLNQYLSYIWDLKLWHAAVILTANAFVACAIAFSLPTNLVDNMDFDQDPESLVLTTPPYLFAAAVSWVCAHFSDKLRLRSPFLLGSNILTIIGLSLSGYTPSQPAKYLSTFFLTLPLTTSLPLLFAWHATNTRTQYKRAAATAFLIGASAAGGLAGAFAFRFDDAPHYVLGHGLCLGAMGVSIVFTGLLVRLLREENQRAGLSGTEGLEGFEYWM